MSFYPVIWILLGFALVLIEFVAPTFVFLFIGVGAIITGLLVWLGLPGAYGLHYLAFAAISAALLFGLRRTARRWFVGWTGDRSSSAAGFDEFIGAEATVVSGFRGDDRRGRVLYRGAEWTAESDATLSPGQRVTIVDRAGANLKVVPAKTLPFLHRTPQHEHD